MGPPPAYPASSPSGSTGPSTTSAPGTRPTWPNTWPGVPPRSTIRATTLGVRASGVTAEKGAQCPRTHGTQPLQQVGQINSNMIIKYSKVRDGNIDAHEWENQGEGPGGFREVPIVWTLKGRGVPYFWVLFQFINKFFERFPGRILFLTRHPPSSTLCASMDGRVSLSFDTESRNNTYKMIKIIIQQPITKVLETWQYKTRSQKVNFKPDKRSNLLLPRWCRN